jgi:hypothetical protein
MPPEISTSPLSQRQVASTEKQRAERGTKNTLSNYACRTRQDGSTNNEGSENKLN